MTQNKSISDLLNEAAAEMVNEAVQQPVEFRKLGEVDVNALAHDWQGRRLVRLNFEVGELGQTSDARPMARTMLGGIFSSQGAVSVAGKPLAIDGIAGATVRLALPDGTVMDFETLRTKEPLTVQSLQIRNRGAWDQVRAAAKAKSRAPQLVVIGAWADYAKELRTPIKVKGKEIGVSWNFAFVALDWGIVFEGETHWVTPRVDAVFLDGLETVENKKPAAIHAADRFGGAVRAAAERKALLAAAFSPAAGNVVENPLTKAGKAPVSDTLDAASPAQEGSLSEDVALAAADDDMS